MLQPGMAQPTMTQATMAQTAQHPAMTQASQHPLMAQTIQHPTMAPAPYLASYRSLPHAGAVSQHPQVQVHIQGQQGNTAQQMPDGQQPMMMQYVPYFHQYPPGRRIHPWPNLPRGMPNPVNGQVPGMQPGLPPQMQVVQGKTTQAGVPGR